MRREQVQRYRRYLRTYLRHCTPVKVHNLLRVEHRLAANNPDLSELAPYFLFVDISNSCNLTCPLCQMGQRKTVRRENRMTLDTYRSVIEPLKDYLFQVFLFNWGEPFVNRDIYEIIAHTSRRNIGTIVSTNFNLPVDPEMLIDSGLEHLIISADGIDQNIYGKYRGGGNIANILRNLDKLVNAKKKRRSRYPFIEWQCLVTRHNEAHLREIEREAMARGANSFRLASINFYSVEDTETAEKEWLPRNPRYRSFSAERIAKKIKGGIRKPCFWLWRTAILNVDGGVIPCCLYDVSSWGNAFEQGLLPIWNGDTYTEARRRSKRGAERRQLLVCDSCRAPFIFR